MKVYIHEPNGTEYITDILKYSIKKYWGDIDLNILKFGNENEYRSPEFWSDDFFNYFSNVDDDFFILMLNDMILMSDVDTDLLEKLEKCLDDSVGRIGLTKDIESRNIVTLDFESKKTKPGWFLVNGNIIELFSNVEYRLSIINSIWNRKFFLSYLKNVKTPWEFETQPQNDNYRILGSKDKYVMRICHLLSREKIKSDWNYDCFSNGKLCDDDYNYIKNQLNIIS